MDSAQNISLSEAIKAEAKKLGFHSCGIAKADFLDKEAGFLDTWLHGGNHAGMTYMENHFEKRTDPRKLVENAKSVISVLYNYYPDEKLTEDGNYRIAKYAYGKDYHHVIKKKLKQLLGFISSQSGVTGARIFVDSAPVLDRAWAVKCGLGWIGKNTCLITKEQGSFFFIGEIICNVELDYNDRIVPDHCGGCTRCIDACPTQALKPYRLDSKRCISYWTIENRSETIPKEFKGKFNDCIFGCDICQDVCPWNRLSEPHQEQAFRLSENLKKMDKTTWKELSHEQFSSAMQGSAIKRAGYRGLKRNIHFISESSISRSA